MVGFQVQMQGRSTFLYVVGNGDFLGAFFDTVALRLENGRRGKRFPVFNMLYQGQVIDSTNLDALKKELSIVATELKKFSPQAVVWDMDDLSIKPPWGDNISSEITDLANYFVTSQGYQLIVVFDKAIDHAISLKTSLKIKSTLEAT